MSALEKAEQAAVEAAQDTRTLEIAAAILAVQKATQQQPACGCHHQQPAPRSTWTAGKVAAVVGGVCVCGVVFTMFFLAVAVAAPSAAASLIILWKLYQAAFGKDR